jgi:hypothetical protein
MNMLALGSWNLHSQEALVALRTPLSHTYTLQIKVSAAWLCMYVCIYISHSKTAAHQIQGARARHSIISIFQADPKSNTCSLPPYVCIHTAESARVQSQFAQIAQLSVAEQASEDVLYSLAGRPALLQRL